ncbi:aldolase/citrate lyase family protein [Candidatus Latescibacterota bacterium]
MRLKRFAMLMVVCMMMLVLTAVVAMAQQAQPPPAAPGTVTYNTVFTKLAKGQQVFCNSVSSPDTAACRERCEGVDYIWIEMQHSPLTWRECQDLINVIVSAGCIPFVRVPQASNASDIQKATDCGALGIIVPMVESVEEARNAVMFTRKPIGDVNNPNIKPWGINSTGGGAAGRLWGRDHRTNFNNNIFIMIMIETPMGVGVIDRILEEVPGINGVMVASTDFSLQSGYSEDDPGFWYLERIVRKSVLAHNVTLFAKPVWMQIPGYMAFLGRRPDVVPPIPKLYVP